MDDPEVLVHELNARLDGGSRARRLPTLPIVFVVGLPRSGTTPLAQLLAHVFRIGYVTNVVARFWNAPEYGIAVARAIAVDPGLGLSDFSSKFGRTGGYEGPHEFGYFWRRWFRFRDCHFLSPAQQRGVDRAGLLRSLARMEQAWARPLFFKNPAALPLQTEFLARVLPNAIFLRIVREPLAVAASLLEARRRYCGSGKKWFSVKPREYRSLRDAPPALQIAGQIHYTDREIDRQLRTVADARKFAVDYRTLLRDPAGEAGRIGEWLVSRSPAFVRRDVAVPDLGVARRTDAGSRFLRDVARHLARLRA